MKLKVTKGSQVEVIAGSDKGKKGSVLEVDHLKLRVRVQGVRVQTKHSAKDGVSKTEGFIDYSNVKLLEKKASPSKKKSAKKTAKA
ncbi:MAG: 50S ribosomal protein L24 [Bdellovibrionales bacterium CG10_big_fil_rev_8_21_14_0_10_45_34]|nr:MAG: 50S ribosomal protein L24 [Bdellovibrionales bacterium CG10_big_fil_rev_8_21_14_0_10_45_34]